MNTPRYDLHISLTDDTLSVTEAFPDEAARASAEGREFEPTFEDLQAALDQEPILRSFISEWNMPIVLTITDRLTGDTATIREDGYGWEYKRGARDDPNQPRLIPRPDEAAPA